MTPREAIALLTKPKSKYRNVKVEKNGETFDSIREYERHLVLLDMQKRGEISDLKRQPRFALEVGDLCVCHYVGDWSYTESGCVVIEDCKGFKTPSFRIKWRLCQALYPNTIWRLS